MASFGNTNQGFGGTGGSGSGGGGSTTFIKLCSIGTGVNIVDTNPKLGYNSLFYDFTLYDCTNYVSGNIVVVWNPSTDQIQFSQTQTLPIGTIPVNNFLVDNLGNFIVTNSGDFILTSYGLEFGFEIVGNSVNTILYTNNSSWKLNLQKTLFEDCCTTPVVSGAFIITENNNDIITENDDYLITE
jgi:hypothetical protein